MPIIRLGLGQGVAAALGVVLSILQARSLSIYDFGTLTTLLSIQAFLFTCSDLGYTHAFFKFSANSNFTGYIVRRNLSFLASSLIVLLVLSIYPRTGISQFGLKEYGLIFLNAWLMVCLSSMTTKFQSTSRFGMVAFLSVIPFLFTVLFILALHLFEVSMSVEVFLGCSISSYLAAVILVFLRSSRNFDLRSLSKTVLNASKLNKSEMVYLRSITPSVILSSIYNRIDIWLLGYLGTSSSVGLYGVGSKFLMPISLAASSLNIWLWPQLAKGASKNTESSLKAANLVIFAVIILILPFFFIMPQFIGLAFGAKYIDAAGVSMVFILKGYLALAVTPWVVRAYLGGHERFMTMISLFQLITNSCLCFILIPKIGALGAAIGSLSIEAVIVIGMVVIGSKPIQSLAKQR